MLPPAAGVPGSAGGSGAATSVTELAPVSSGKTISSVTGALTPAFSTAPPSGKYACHASVLPRAASRITAGAVPVF